MTPRSSSPAIQSLGLQLAATLLPTVLLLALSLPSAAISMALGGGIAVLGNAVMVFAVFGAYRAAAVRDLTGRMMLAQVFRLLLIAAAFAGVFARYDEPDLLALFGGFLAVHLLPVWWVHRASAQAMKR
ncbi:ATP synthase subunit I [Thioalkalivibrio sp. ALJ24]|uniref:ATP synthase subunit I n=1 Tax=Thioalkalivibrio sp. ALJ24 TaxID=545276 RepID=UPI000475A304|nr:ATP synthase subunit I [Thioalkalivibrio sp. ALJ24]